MTPPPSLRGLRILVVDGASTIRSVLGSLLRLEGADIVEVATGREALAAVRRAHFHIALTDLGLRDIPGEALIPRIRALTAGRTAVAVLAGACEEETVVALEVGAEAAFSKPVEWLALLSYLRRQVSRLGGQVSVAV
jgi:two-component system response regulator MtrA